MESKILIDSHYNGDGQLIINYKPNEEDLRDKIVGRFLWRYAVGKRGFALIDIYDDHSDGSCKATIKPLSLDELAQYLPEITKLIEKGIDSQPRPNA